MARYIDLEIDVVEKADKREIIDREKLDRIKNEDIITKESSTKTCKIMVG